MSQKVVGLPVLDAAHPTSDTQLPTPDGQGYHIMTWGCQMNEEDSEQMGLYLERMGLRPVSDAADAAVVLLNTCSVRAKPEEKVWSELGRLKDLKRERPDMIIGVCGCMAQVESAEIKRRAPHVDMVIGTNNIATLPELIEKVRTGEHREAPYVSPSIQNPNSKFQNLLTLTALELPPRKGTV